MRNSAQFVFATSVVLFQQSQQSLPVPGCKLPGVQRPVIVGICSAKTTLNDCEILFLGQRSIVIRVSGGELSGAQPTCKFTAIEGTVLVAIELVKQRGGSAFHLLK